jgi:hypothetical protein
VHGLAKSIGCAALFIVCTFSARAQDLAPYYGFANPQRVTIQGYDDHAMEPFLSRDGRWLLFNNSNAPDAQTDLHAAEKIDDVTFVYRGPVAGANSASLDGVPAMDSGSNLFFVSMRSYDSTLASIFQGHFNEGTVAGVSLVPGVSRGKPGWINFDVDVSPDGNTLYFADGRYTGGSSPVVADLAVATKTGASFQRAPNSAFLMKFINTRALEYAACISASGLELFFTRLNPRTLTSGIYRATRSRTSLPFGPPRRVAAATGFVEAPTLSPDERSLYFHKLENDRFVIYRIAR